MNWMHKIPLPFFRIYPLWKDWNPNTGIWLPYISILHLCSLSDLAQFTLCFGYDMFIVVNQHYTPRLTSVIHNFSLEEWFMWYSIVDYELVIWIGAMRFAQQFILPLNKIKYAYKFFSINLVRFTEKV